MRLATEINSGTVKAGQRFQGNLVVDLVADGRVLAPKGSRVYVRVVEAGAGAGGQPVLVLELTDLEVGGRVVPLATEPSRQAAASGAPGNQVAVPPGRALEFKLARPVSVDVVI